MCLGCSFQCYLLELSFRANDNSSCIFDIKPSLILIKPSLILIHRISSDFVWSFTINILESIWSTRSVWLSLFQVILFFFPYRSRFSASRIWGRDEYNNPLMIVTADHGQSRLLFGKLAQKLRFSADISRNQRAVS